MKFRIWDKISEKMIHRDESLYLSMSGEVKSHEGADMEYRSHRFIPLLFTGFKDINNKELFIGDCVVFHYGNRKETLVWDINGWDNLCYLLDEASERGAMFEIIGNIYENPELIK